MSISVSATSLMSMSTYPAMFNLCPGVICERESDSPVYYLIECHTTH
jgi:hypothetical protein